MLSSIGGPVWLRKLLREFKNTFHFFNCKMAISNICLMCQKEAEIVNHLLLHYDLRPMFGVISLVDAKLPGVFRGRLKRL